MPGYSALFEAPELVAFTAGDDGMQVSMLETVNPGGNVTTRIS